MTLHKQIQIVAFTFISLGFLFGCNDVRKETTDASTPTRQTILTEPKTQSLPKQKSENTQAEQQHTDTQKKIVAEPETQTKLPQEQLSSKIEMSVAQPAAKTATLYCFSVEKFPVDQKFFVKNADGQFVSVGIEDENATQHSISVCQNQIVEVFMKKSETDIPVPVASIDMSDATECVAVFVPNEDGNGIKEIKAVSTANETLVQGSLMIFNFSLENFLGEILARKTETDEQRLTEFSLESGEFYSTGAISSSRRIFEVTLSCDGQLKYSSGFSVFNSSKIFLLAVSQDDGEGQQQVKFKSFFISER